MPETEPWKLRSSFLTRLKHGSKGSPFSEAHNAWPRTCSVLPGSRTWRIGPEPENWIDPAAPPSSRMRPAPRLPSKHRNANVLPETNRRASSAFMVCPAIAGTAALAARTANEAPNTTRANILNSNLTGRDVFTRCLPYQPWQHWRRLVGKV